MDFLRVVAVPVLLGAVVLAMILYGVGRFVRGWWKWRPVRKYRRASRDARFLSLKDGDVHHPSTGKRGA